MGPSLRHGSEATSAIRFNSCDRDRSERSLSRTEREPDHTIIRTWPTGPQEAMDWAAALDTMVNRVAPFERVNRSHAQLITDGNERTGYRGHLVAFYGAAAGIALIDDKTVFSADTGYDHFEIVGHKLSHGRFDQFSVTCNGQFSGFRRAHFSHVY